ncbi:hypothetical protein N7460_006719 [Penicillium canescens]|uniref:Uncharacterized protein n=1 Tax=Penicillium canescens TaxID=5083 RepID=A0AAD6IB48_PENCN|nr:hypothetical protein N7460_006719 [Penicillium canescens]
MTCKFYSTAFPILGHVAWGSLVSLGSLASIAYASPTAEQSDTIPSGSDGSLEFNLEPPLDPGVYNATLQASTNFDRVDLGDVEVPRCASNQRLTIRVTYSWDLPSGPRVLSLNDSPYPINIQNPSLSSRRDLESPSNQNAISAYCATESGNSSIEPASSSTTSMASQTSSQVDSVSMADLPTTQSSTPGTVSEPDLPSDNSSEHKQFDYHSSLGFKLAMHLYMRVLDS